MKKNLMIILPIVVATLIILGISIYFIARANNSKVLENTANEVVQSNPSMNATLSQGQWPTGNLMAALPKIEVGTVGNVVETQQGISVNVLNLELLDYQNYIAKTQQSGFTNITQSTSSTNTILYSAKNASGLLLRTSYSTETKKMSLVISQED